MLVELLLCGREEMTRLLAWTVMVFMAMKRLWVGLGDLEDRARGSITLRKGAEPGLFEIDG